MKGFVKNLHEVVKTALSRRFRGFIKVVIKTVQIKMSTNPFRRDFVVQNEVLKKILVNKFLNAHFLELFEETQAPKK